MPIRAARRHVLAALLLAFAAGADAADEFEFDIPVPALAHAVWLDTYASSNEVRDYLVELDLAVTLDEHLLLSGGQTRYAASDGDIDAESFMVGLRSRRLPATDVGLRYKYWGDNDEFTVRTVQPDLTGYFDRWWLGANGEFRSFELFTRPIAGSRREAEFDSTGYTLSLGYAPERGAGFALAMSRYDYSKDIRLLATLRATFVISPRAQTLSGGLLDSREQAEVGYRWSSHYLGLVYTQDVSGIDQSRADTYALRWRFAPAQSWSLELEGGHLQVENGDDYNYGRVAVGYFWRADLP
jgi:hypothetical protein